MNRIQYAKILSLVAAIATATVSAINGDLVTGFGILAAAFSSSSVFDKGT